MIVVAATEPAGAAPEHLAVFDRADQAVRWLSRVHAAGRRRHPSPRAPRVGVSAARAADAGAGADAEHHFAVLEAAVLSSTASPGQTVVTDSARAQLETVAGVSCHPLPAVSGKLLCEPLPAWSLVVS